MPDYLTTAEVAARLGVTPQRVRAIAAARGVPPALRAGNALFWRRADLRRLARRPTGRPRQRRRPAS